MSGEVAASPRPARRLFALAAAFGLLTALGIAWAVVAAGVGGEDLAALTALSPASLAAVGALALGVLACEMVRFRVFGAAIGARLSWLACWDATIFNFFFAWLTPGAALAEPATIYALGRRDVPWDAAVVVSFGKSFTSFAVILAAALGLLAVGAGPRLHPALLLPFASGSAVLLALTAVVAVGATRPDRLTAWLESTRAGLVTRRPFAGPRASRALGWLARTLSDAVRRASQLRRLGALGWLGIALSHLVYYAAFVGVFLVLARALGASALRETAAAAVIYQGFTYVAPTPGGAGLSEATAEAFFGHVLTPEAAALGVVAFRAVTFYLHLALGAVYVPAVGGARAVFAAAEGRAA